MLLFDCPSIVGLNAKTLRTEFSRRQIDRGSILCV